MRVFVCGAEYRNSPGFAIAKRLLAEGHSVAALSRFRGGGQSLTNIGIELVVGDVEDADVQGQIVKADAVIDAELPRPDTREKKELARLRPSLLRRTLEGADRPLIATSSVDVLGDTGPAPLGEGAPFHAPPKYLGWLPSLDREILQSVGVRGMVIRPALVYGLSPMPGQRDDIPYPPRGMETWIALAIQFNQGKYIGSGANCWSAVHRDDLADLYCLALEKAGAGTLLNASSETFSIKELAEVIHRAFGFKGEPSSLSLDEARRVTPGTEADFLNCNRAISGDLAVRTVGWQPTRPSIMKEVEELVQLYLKPDTFFWHIRKRILSPGPVKDARARILDLRRESRKSKVPVPELKQKQDLSIADFERHPVWVGVHTMDSGKPWYDACDEDTLRPWTEPLPASPQKGMLFVAATIVLRDESMFRGYVRVVGEGWDVPPPPRKMLGGGTVQHRPLSARLGGSPLAVLGLQQPKIFVNQQCFSFWGRLAADRREAFYAAIGKPPEDIFPLRLSVHSKFATGILTGRVDGFYRGGGRGRPPQVEL